MGSNGNRSNEGRQVGVVQRIVAQKGFGFVKAANATQEFFFHRSAIDDGVFEDMYAGQTVTFIAAMGEKGPRAEHIHISDR